MAAGSPTSLTSRGILKCTSDLSQALAASGRFSGGGGLSPKWSRNGKELFYSTEDSKIMVATYVVSGDSFPADNPRPWSPLQFSQARGYTSNFDLHPDGKRFAVLKAPAASESAPGKVTLILNFFDELRTKVPL